MPINQQRLPNSHFLKIIFFCKNFLTSVFSVSFDIGEVLGWSLGPNRGIEGGGDIGIVVPKVLFLLLVGVIPQIVVGFYKSEVFKLFRIVFYTKAVVILIIVNGSSINTKSFYLGFIT